MIKIKISKSNKFAISSEPSSFDITLKNGKEEVKGKLIIDTVKKTIRVDLGRPLTDYTQKGIEHEQLAVLKEIFYCFCITECRRGRKPISEHIEEYKFIDEHKREDRKTVIDYIMCYDKDEFNEYKRKEKIIYSIKLDYDKIRKDSKYNRLIELGIMNDFSEKEIEVYKKILLKYLKSKELYGKLYDVSEKYNNAYRLEYPYYYNFNLFYAFEYLLDKTS